MLVWFRRMRSVSIPSDRTAFVACWVAGAVLGVVALGMGAGWVGGLLAGLAAVAGSFFSALVFVSPQKVGEDAIRVGEQLRPFSALDEAGSEFSSVSLAGKPVLLKFFRGHW